MFRDNPTPPRFAKVRVRKDEILTQNNLAFDLRDMDELRMKGVPISSQSLANQYYDGNPSGDIDNFDIPYENARLVDINDVWNRSKDAHQQITKAQIKSTDLNPK